MILSQLGVVSLQHQEGSLYNLSKYQGFKTNKRKGRQRRLLPYLALLSMIFLAKTASAEATQDGTANQVGVAGASTIPSGSNHDTQDSQQYQAGEDLPRIRIDGINPEAGPTSGETRVLVRGGPFNQYQLRYPKPMCKFGHDDMVVEATYVLCTASPNWIQEKEAHHRDKVLQLFSLIQIQHELCLQCDNSPASSKTEIVPFTVSLTGDFSDVSNSVPFRFYPPTRIYSIYPRYGPKDGETVVQIWGENFLNFDENTRCAFGTKSVPATFINSNYMICVSPFSDVVEKPIPLSISLNNQQNSKDTEIFWYYSWPAINDLIPDRGPDQGGTRVLLKGRNFHPFGEMTAVNNSNDTFCMFENLGKVPATVINSTKAICYSPPSYVLRESIVEITLNNQQYTDDNNVFHHYRPPYLFDINPREGPVSGGTKVIAVGSNFRNTENVTCKFNETIVPGKYLSSSEIECYSPRVDFPGFVPLSVSLELDMYSPAVQYLYYERPVIDSIEPMCGPEQGFTQITVKGKNFLDMGHDQMLCVFNKTIFTNATIMDPETIKCDSPSILNEQGYSQITNNLVYYYVEITIDGGREISGPPQKFTYYIQPKVLDITPNSGPLSGGTLVKVTGQGFNQDGACNKTLRFSVFETKPINATNDTLAYVYSPPASVPDAVVVGIALNGQQFIKDITLHVKDVENTFEYYLDPFVTSFEPNNGPSIGGTKITISGIGFTPRKDNSGALQKSNNKMWVRFVDPITLNQLAPIQQVKTDQLTDDSAIYYTPALPGGTLALMQISLNGVNWHNVPFGKNTYSFSYYDSPHVISVSPTYGPVKSSQPITMDITGTNIQCPDVNCTDLMVKFGDHDHWIFVKATYINDQHIQVQVPFYSRPDVLKVEFTVNGKDWTNDGKTFGFFDPYILRAEPALVSIDGTTKIRLKGFGFVNTTSAKSLIRSSYSNLALVCQGNPCIRDATFIDKHTLLTTVNPQSLINYQQNNNNVLWDPMVIDASILGSDLSTFTNNSVLIFFYEDPEFKDISVTESPANIESQIFFPTDFKKNSIERLKKNSNVTCRFKGEDGTVIYTQGEMVKYPLDQGQPNAIQCKSPVWNLNGKYSETVKLEIAMNGEDFKGNFDFTFTQQLTIQRIIPMAGPAIGGSRTRIIGTGLKSNISYVDLKWGVFTSTDIPKNQVEDYIYQKNAFENMIEGSEELKSYIYEASQFARVDTQMVEDAKYQSIYVNSPTFDQWAQIHGGPYSVEVGKNIQIKYKANATASTNSTITEQDAINMWTFYEFDPSSVEYYYYKDCTVKEIQPHQGLIIGGTQVSVSGSWFKYMPEYGVVPHCKFGDKVVRAQFDSTVRIVCTIPPGDDLGVMLPFEVSLNGVDFTDSGLKFSYYDIPVLQSISPSMGPEAGGTLIYIYGSNFTNNSNPQDFHCKFTPINMPIPPKKMPGIFMNSSTIMCASPGGWGQGVAVKLQVTFNGADYDSSNFIYTFFSTTRAFPRSGPSDGSGGDIIIEGVGFRNDTNPLCRINNTLYEPTLVSWKQIRCPMPKAPSPDYFGNVELAVAPNGIDWTDFVGGFQFYPQPIIDDIYPKQGPSLGVGIINFYGSGFRNDYNLVDMACKIGDSVGKAVYVSPQHMKCVVEDMDLVNEGEYLPAQLALNRYSWTTLSNSTFFLPYGIEQIYPNSGPISGVTDVIVQGKGFVEVDGNPPRCRFGTPANYAIVEAQILSYERLVCKTPIAYFPSIPGTFPEDVPFGIAFANEENDPWTESSHKFRFYQQPILSRCDPCEINVGTIIEVYVTAEENSQFFEPLPSVSLSSSDQDAEQSGIMTMPSSLGGITCQFGRFGETQAIYVNMTTIKCITPSIDEDPDSIYRETVKLTVAMNGVDHEEQTSELEFQFIGTGSYLVFWPYFIGILLIGLLIVALIMGAGTWSQYVSSLNRMKSGSSQPDGMPHVMNLGGGVMVPRGRADWNAERSSVDILQRASGQQIS